MSEPDIICQYVQVKGEIFTKRKRMIRLYLAESRGASYNLMAGMNREIRALHRNGMENLAAVFESGIQRGYFRAVADPFYLAIALDSTINAFLLLWMEKPEHHPLSEGLQKMKTIFFEPILNSTGEQESC